MRGLLDGGSGDGASAGRTATSGSTPSRASTSATPSARTSSKATSTPKPTTSRTSSHPSPRPSDTSVAGLSSCALNSLPSQADDTVDEIYRGGPYPYRQDGVIFDNREQRLPHEAHGYYHEFTVVTPGSADRGTRRIIVGGSDTEAPEVLYYTGNHYASFCVVSGLD